MGYNDFKPTDESVNSLNDTAKGLEKELRTFLKADNNLTGVKLIIKAARGFERDPFSDSWYNDYPALLQECEMKLVISIKGGLLRKDSDVSYAKAKISPFPACCGICVLNGVELHNEIRGGGIGKEFVKVVEAFAKCLNYSYIMCTTHKTNGPAIGIVECLGYTELDAGFANARTNNSIRMFGKNINPNGKALTDGYLSLKER